ncbi:hypothetical protein F4808DRAFT_377166 [Astrocystis sublimbata]|nr:hypothetical protein F4808DRAFT_377166 [Astrocystis sublimbata]
MDVQQVLSIPDGEIAFEFHWDPKDDKLEKDYERLQVGRKGLRAWTSFEEHPGFLQPSMVKQVDVPADWKPYIDAWDRYVRSELNLVDLLKKTLLLRVKIALAAVSPGTSIIGTTHFFNSLGKKVRIAPDLLVLDGGANLQLGEALEDRIVAIGDVKVKQPDEQEDTPKDLPRLLPGTSGCFEPWLAQPVQCCMDKDVPFGFVLTNREIVLFQLVRENDDLVPAQRRTRSSGLKPDDHDKLSPSASQEPIHSSPSTRETQHWEKFYEGDVNIPRIDVTSPPSAPQQPTVPSTAQQPTVPSTESSPLSSPPSDISMSYPSPSSNRQRPVSSDVSMGSSPPLQRDSQSSNFTNTSPENKDLSYILIRAYDLDTPGVAERFLEFIMLAQKVKDQGRRAIGPSMYIRLVR